MRVPSSLQHPENLSLSSKHGLRRPARLEVIRAQPFLTTDLSFLMDPVRPDADTAMGSLSFKDTRSKGHSPAVTRQATRASHEDEADGCQAEEHDAGGFGDDAVQTLRENEIDIWNVS